MDLRGAFGEVLAFSDLGSRSLTALAYTERYANEQGRPGADAQGFVGTLDSCWSARQSTAPRSLATLFGALNVLCLLCGPMAKVEFEENTLHLAYDTLPCKFASRP